MPLLATFTFVGVACLAGGYAQLCVPHSLGTQPDWAVWQGSGSIGNSVSLISRTGAIVWLINTGGGVGVGEVTAQYVHSIIR